MSTKAHIYIYGEIGSGDPFFGSDGFVSLKSVVDVINANPQADEFVVHIHSRGGEVSEGFAIHDALKATGKSTTTIIEGLCASIATVIALAGDVRQMTPNSEFFIHNPWGIVGGDANEIQKYADQVKSQETKLIDFYASKTGADTSQIHDLMNSEDYLTPAQALELKFITQILEPAKAYAKIKFTPMANDNAGLIAEIKNMVSEIKNLFTSKVKALDLSTEDGKMISIASDGDPKVGDTCTMDGQPCPDGEYKMKNGTTVTVAGGKISEIKTTEAAATPDAAATEELKAEIENLKKAQSDLLTENTELKAAVAAKAELEKTVNAKFEALQTSLKAMKLDFNIETGAASMQTKNTQIKSGDKSPAQQAIDAAKEKAAAKK